jgi:shikimate dehydrogenase
MMLRSGLFGRAILASRSPWLHEQEARAQGLDLDYTLFDFNERGLADNDLAPLLHDLRDQGYCGVNVTYPFKQAVIPLLDELAESAEMVGAVNTIAMCGGRLIGHNTDVTGFQYSFAEGLPGVSLSHVLQLGAGGAGAAVANAMLSLGTRVLEIADVDLAKAQALATRLAARFGKDRVISRDCRDIDTSGIDGIINTTPMGMAAHPGSPIAPGLIAAHHWVADIVYFPLETEMLRIARERGCRTLDGSGMVITQAALAFAIFTGRTADRARMRQSFAAS